TMFLIQSIHLFSNRTLSTDLSTLSLHDALPICSVLMTAGYSKPVCRESISFTMWIKLRPKPKKSAVPCLYLKIKKRCGSFRLRRSEEHTSELQSRFDLVCRLLLEKKN